MLDIMTIILVFLLKSLGESSASIPQNKDMMLPHSIIRTQPTEEGVIVMISKTQILVGDNQVLQLPGRESLAQTGRGRALQAQRPERPLHRAAGQRPAVGTQDGQARSARPRGSTPRARRPSSWPTGQTPYRLLIEVLFTLGQSEFGKYHLMVVQSKGAEPG